MDLSFGWTTPALVVGEKTVTRRDWKPRHAAHFHCGDVVRALNRQWRNGGEPIGTVRLTEDVLLQSTADAPPSDWRAEGFDFLEERGVKVDGVMPAVLWRSWHWRMHARYLYVVRFELVELTELGLAMRRSLLYAA